MCMYYPYDTTLEMGPTCVVPGSQYYEVDRLQWGTLFTDSEMPETNLHGEQDAWKADVAAASETLQGSNAEARTELTQKAGRFFKSTSSFRLYLLIIGVSFTVFSKTGDCMNSLLFCLWPKFTE